MNTEQNNLKPEIEVLKQESAPAHLKARIVQAILDEKKSKTMTTKKLIGFGLPAIAAGALVVAAAMTPKTALADPIAQVRSAFEAAQNYHMTTYHVEAGQRTRVSESWVQNGKRTTYMVNKDGTLNQLGDIFMEVQDHVSVEFVKLAPAQAAKGEEIKGIREYVIVSDKLAEPKKDGKTEFKVTSDIPPQSVEGKPGKAPLVILQAEGSNIELQLMPFIDAEMSIEALQKLLEDKSLWDIEPNQILNGRQVQLYKLKESYMDFSVFVNAQTKLPVLTRQIINGEDGKPATTTEVEYDYNGAEPPVSAQKADKTEGATLKK